MKKFFGVVIMFIAICELIGSIQMKNGTTTIICFTIGLFLFGLYLYLPSKKQEDTSKNKKHSVSNPEGFTPTKIVDKYMEIDEVNKKWITVSYMLGKRLNSSIYDYSDIVQFELLEDGNTVTKGGLGRALVGGAMFGGVGAIVGGVTGKKSTNTYVDSLRIKVTTKNINNPVVYIDLINMRAKTDSIYYRSMYNKAQEILSLLSIMQEESNRDVDVPVNNTSTNNFSVADEILKLSELKEKGILTEEEFQLKKKQLLN